MSSTYDPSSLLGRTTVGVLATLHRDGRAQLSPVLHHHDRDGSRLLISTRDGLVKTRNLRRTPWAALQVTSADTLSWATAEGRVDLSGPGTDPSGPEVDALVEYFQLAAGDHPDWDEYRDVMVAERRVLITLRIEHVYGEQVAGLT